MPYGVAFGNGNGDGNGGKPNHARQQNRQNSC
jgi:hypothetical protein